MDRPQLEKLSPLFNEESGKVVSFHEYECKEKYLLQQGLTRAEKAVSFFGEMRQVFSWFARGGDNKGITRYVDPANPGMATYIPAREIAEIELGVYAEGRNKKLQEKILKLRLEALRECADYSYCVKSGGLKPL